MVTRSLDRSAPTAGAGQLRGSFWDGNASHATLWHDRREAQGQADAKLLSADHVTDANFIAFSKRGVILHPDKGAQLHVRALMYIRNSRRTSALVCVCVCLCVCVCV